MRYLCNRCTPESSGQTEWKCAKIVQTGSGVLKTWANQTYSGCTLWAYAVLYVVKIFRLPQLILVHSTSVSAGHHHPFSSCCFCRWGGRGWKARHRASSCIPQAKSVELPPPQRLVDNDIQRLLIVTSNLSQSPTRSGTVVLSMESDCSEVLRGWNETLMKRG